MSFRDIYIEEYKKLGKSMFKYCEIPTVNDFAVMSDKVKNITTFTGNYDDVVKSCKRRTGDYTEEESKKFIDSVIAANVTDITESGTFYKMLMASCDDMKITEEDCGCEGFEIELPVSEEEYNYKIRNHFITELNDFSTEFSDIENFDSIHVRSPLSCDLKHRTFCVKCAGLFRREFESSFIPENIGIYSTLMITEHATQASLDSMNKGVSVKINKALETKLQNGDYGTVVNEINKIIDMIGFVGVESRFYEIALLSRYHLDDEFNFNSCSFKSSIMRGKDLFGQFIYRPNKATFQKLISTKETIDATSTKSKIAFDKYEEE